MSLVLVDDGTDRERWLLARAVEGRVSATDAARIMTGGAGTWASLRKEKAQGSSFRGNSYTRHGNEREAAIAAFAQTEFGLIPSTALVAAADSPLDVATPDALSVPVIDGVGVEELGGLQHGLQYTVDEFGEYKTTVHDWPTKEDVPRRYYWQVVHQFRVTGAQRCRFVFEHHENFVPLHMEPRVFTYERDEVEADIAASIERVNQWRTAEHAEVPEALLPLDLLLSQRERAKEAAQAAEDRAAEAEAAIRELLTAHGQAVEFEGTDANVSYTGTPRSSQRFNAAAFKSKYPHAAARFTTTVVEKQPRLGITTRS